MPNTLLAAPHPRIQKAIYISASTSLHCLAVRFTLGNPRMNVTREADESYTMKASWVKRRKKCFKKMKEGNNVNI